MNKPFLLQLKELKDRRAQALRDRNFEGADKVKMEIKKLILKEKNAQRLHTRSGEDEG